MSRSRRFRIAPVLSFGLAWTAVLALLLAPVSAGAQGISLIRDAETEHMLRDMTDPIFAAAGLNAKSVDIYLVNDQSQNAFVAAGQKMFFHTGIITASEEPNELIGVIAHETGHITGGHLARSSEAIAAMMRPTLIGAAIGLAAIAAGAPQVGAAVLAGSQQVGQRAYFAFSRSQEASADQAALYFLNQTHQSGKGLLTFFDRFRDQIATLSHTVDPYTQTHPLSRERIQALESGVKASAYYGAGDSPEMKRRLNLVKAKLYGFIERPDVALRRYPVTDQSETARYARSVIYFRQGRIDDALAEIDHLIANDPDNPYFVELKGQILFEGGRVGDSVAPYAKAVAMAPDEPLIRTSYGQSLAAQAELTGDAAMTQQAIKELRAAIADEADLTIAWRALAQAYSNAGDEPMAQLATAELYFNAGQMGQAASFAQRALPKLEKGTTAHIRASDIIQLASVAGGGENGRPPDR